MMRKEKVEMTDRWSKDREDLKKSMDGMTDRWKKQMDEMNERWKRDRDEIMKDSEKVSKDLGEVIVSHYFSNTMKRLY